MLSFMSPLCNENEIRIYSDILGVGERGKKSFWTLFTYGCFTTQFLAMLSTSYIDIEAKQTVKEQTKGLLWAIAFSVACWWECWITRYCSQVLGWRRRSAQWILYVSIDDSVRCWHSSVKISPIVLIMLRRHVRQRRNGASQFY